MVGGVAPGVVGLSGSTTSARFEGLAVDVLVLRPDCGGGGPLAPRPDGRYLLDEVVDRLHHDDSAAGVGTSRTRLRLGCRSRGWRRLPCSGPDGRCSCGGRRPLPCNGRRGRRIHHFQGPPGHVVHHDVLRRSLEVVHHDVPPRFLHRDDSAAGVRLRLGCGHGCSPGRRLQRRRGRGLLFGGCAPRRSGRSPPFSTTTVKDAGRVGGQTVQVGEIGIGVTFPWRGTRRSAPIAGGSRARRIPVLRAPAVLRRSASCAGASSCPGASVEKRWRGSSCSVMICELNVLFRRGGTKRGCCVRGGSSCSCIRDDFMMIFCRKIFCLLCWIHETAAL